MQIGNYTVEGELARGGSAIVYRVRDPRGSVRALKLLQARSEQAARRFEVEVGAVARLRHEHLVPVLAWGRDRAPFLVMPLVAGGTLEQRLAREGPLPLPTALRLAHQLALALAYAHRCGVAHRDVKPDNVLLGEDGRALLTDFSLAFDAELEHSRLTRSGALQGTPGYWAPEQCLGQTKTTAGPLTDVYGLGATLFATLTGEPPFGATVQAALQVAAPSAAPRVSTLRADVTPELDAICRRCLAKDPAERFPDMDALARALAAAGRAPARVAAGGRRGWVALGGLVALLVALAGVGAWVVRGSPATEEPPPVVVTVERSLLERARELRRAGDLMGAAALLDAWRRGVPEEVWSTDEAREVLAELRELNDEILAAQRLQLDELCAAIVRRAREQREAGDYEAAKASLTKLLEQDPEHEEAKRELLKVMTLSAEPVGEQLQDVATLQRRLRAALARSDRAEAKRLARAILEQVPDDMNALYTLLEQATYERRFAEAEGYANRMAQLPLLDPQRSTCYLMRADARAGMGRLAEARADLDESIRLRPSAPAYVQRARLRRRSDPQGCLEDARRAVELQPTVSNRYDLGYYCSRINAAEEAVEVLEPLVLEAPDYREVWAQLGNAYLGVGRHEDAERAFTQQFTQGAKVPDGVHWGRAQARIRLGDHAGALEDYDALNALQPDQPEALLAVGLLRLELGQREAGLERLRAVVAVLTVERIGSSTVSVLLAQAYDALGQQERAMEALDQNENLIPGCRIMLDNGWFAGWLRSGMRIYGERCLRGSDPKRGERVLRLWLEYFKDDEHAPAVEALLPS